MLVEGYEEGEHDAAVAVVRLMYDTELAPELLSTLQLAQVRVACENCCL
jgi:hypothetical protein